MQDQGLTPTTPLDEIDTGRFVGRTATNLPVSKIMCQRMPLKVHRCLREWCYLLSDSAARTGSKTAMLEVVRLGLAGA